MCLVGAQIYSKAAFFIFLVVNVVLVTIFASFFAVSPREVVISRDSNLSINASFTGFNISTLRDNMYGREGLELHTGKSRYRGGGGERARFSLQKMERRAGAMVG